MGNENDLTTTMGPVQSNAETIGSDFSDPGGFCVVPPEYNNGGDPPAEGPSTEGEGSLAIVSAENGIRLHATDSPNDEAYNSREGIYGNIIDRGIEIRAYSTNNGWALIKIPGGHTGYIEESFIRIVQPSDSDSVTMDYHLVSSGDMLEPIIRERYPNYNYSTGNDRRTILEAIVRLNSDTNMNSIMYSDSNRESFLNALKDVVDSGMSDARNLYQTVQLRENTVLRLPSTLYIDLLRENGELSSRPEWMNDTIEAGRLIQGFISGIGSGFVDAAVSTVEDIWGIIKGIVTGELFETIWNLVKRVIDEGPGFIWDMFKDFINGALEDVQNALNNPNPQQKGNFFGKIVGNILFEIVVAVFTAGVGSVVRNSARFAKVRALLPNVDGIASRLRRQVDADSPELGDEFAESLQRQDRPDGDVSDGDLDTRNDVDADTDSPSPQVTRRSGNQMADTLGYREIPAPGYHWYRKSNGELGVRNNAGNNGPRKAIELDNDGHHVLEADGNPRIVDVDVNVRRATRTDVDSLSVSDLTEGQQNTLNELIEARRNAANSRDSAIEGSAAQRAAAQEMRQASYRMGEEAADAYMRNRGGRRIFPPESEGVGGVSRSGEFDQVWELDGDVVIVEAKGGTAGLGTRRVGTQTVQQGTPEYMADIINNLSDRTLQRRLQGAMEGENLRYLEIKMKVTSNGDLGDLTVKEFNINGTP